MTNLRWRVEGALHFPNVDMRTRSSHPDMVGGNDARYTYPQQVACGHALSYFESFEPEKGCPLDVEVHQRDWGAPRKANTNVSFL